MVQVLLVYSLPWPYNQPFFQEPWLLLLENSICNQDTGICNQGKSPPPLPPQNHIFKTKQKKCCLIISTSGFSQGLHLLSSPLRRKRSYFPGYYMFSLDCLSDIMTIKMFRLWDLGFLGISPSVNSSGFNNTTL